MKNQPYNNNPPLLSSSPGFGSFKLKQPQSLGAGCSSHGRHIVCSSISPPSTLATLSGYLTGISSFVSQNITASLGRPSGAPTAPENQALSPVNSNNVRDDKLGKAALISASQKEEVVFSKFQWIDWSASQSPRLFLLLGYWNGVQIWDVSDTETAVEIISIRDGWGAVTDINVIATPWSPQGASDTFKSNRPLFAFVERISKPNNVTHRAIVASLATKCIVKTIDFGSTPMAEMRIDRNSKYLAFNLGVDVGIEIYSMVDFTKLIVFSDVHPSPPWNDPIFELGSRFAVYTTTTLFDALSPQIALATRNRHGIDLESPGLYSGTTSIGHEGSLLRGIGDHAGIGQGRNMHGGGSSNGVGSGATGVYAGEIATKVAKGVASGVKVIGEYGYHAISNYFAASAATERMGGGDGRGDKGDHPRGIRTGSSFNNAVNGSDNFKEAAHGGGVSALSHDSRTERKKDVHDGVIIIRSLPSYQPPSPSLPLSNYNSFSTPQIAGEIGISKVISLYKPHTNPIAILMLDSSETRLYTTSVEGMSVYVWDISDIYIRNANCSSVAGHGSSSLVIPTCLFRCDRGYTAAKIESISPSFDGKWISVLTARGTAHIFHTEFGSSSATNGRDGGTTLSTKHTQPEFANSHRMVAAKVLSPIVRLNARSSINVVKDLFTQDQTMLETGASDLNETVDTKSFDNAFKAAGTQKTNCQPSQSTTTHISGDMYYSYNGHMAEFLPPMQGNASASTVSCAERQHLLVWDPSGTLTLFWLDLVPTSDLLKSTSPLPPPVLHMLSGFPHATYVRTVARRGGLGTAVLKSEYKVLTMPASKWVLARDTLWDQVWMQDRITTSIKDAYKIDAQRWLPEHQKQLWPSCIEISTCSDLRVPLWMDLQCAMQVYHPDQATKTLVSLMDDAAAASSPGGSGNRGQIGSIRPHVRPRASFSDVPLATNIVIAPYTPTPHGDRKGFPRLDGNAELEKGILSAMGDGMDMPVSQQSLLDSFFSEDDGFNVIKSAHSIPAVDLKHDGYEPHIELQATSMVTTAWGTVRRALDCSNANMVQNGVGKEVSRAFDTDTIHSTLSYGDSDDDCDMPVNAEIHATCASQDESVVPRAVASPNSVSIGVSSIVSDVCDPGITDPVNYILAMSPEETPKD